MKFFVRAYPNSKRESVTVDSPNSLSVRVGAPAQEGRANARLVELLAEHFKVSKSQVSILKGGTSKTKIVEIIK